MKLLLAALLISFGVFAQDDTPAASPAVPAAPTLPPRDQARSMIVTQYGIVAASQFLASQAGAKRLESGGNAIDAAIAANAVLGLTQPYVNGMGGDLFAIVYEAKTGKEIWVTKIDAGAPVISRPAFITKDRPCCASAGTANAIANAAMNANRRGNPVAAGRRPAPRTL